MIKNDIKSRILIIITYNAYKLKLNKVFTLYSKYIFDINLRSINLTVVDRKIILILISQAKVANFSNYINRTFFLTKILLIKKKKKTLTYSSLYMA